MATRNPNEPGPLTREEADFFKAAFLAALPIVLGSDGNLVDRSKSRIVELVSELAQDCLEAYRKAAKGQRS